MLQVLNEQVVDLRPAPCCSGIARCICVLPALSHGNEDRDVALVNNSPVTTKSLEVEWY